MAGFLSRLFGGGGEKPARVEPSEEYNGFTITPAPVEAAGGYRIGATIEKDGRRHDLIRADVLRDREGAIEASLLKARQTIDQMGERLFDGG
jgi:hypothetical protein